MRTAGLSPRRNQKVVQTRLVPGVCFIWAESILESQVGAAVIQDAGRSAGQHRMIRPILLIFTNALLRRQRPY
jgi:hypothetical protein